MMRLESPWFLLLLAALPLWLWGRRYFLAPPSMQFPCETLIHTVAGKGRARFTWIPTFFKAAGLLLLVAGLARPVFRVEKQSFQREGIDLFLLMDISSSMSEKVLDGNRSNLQVAGDVVKAFVQGRQSDRIGLISFARFPKLECPPDHGEGCRA